MKHPLTLSLILFPALALIISANNVSAQNNSSHNKPRSKAAKSSASKTRARQVGAGASDAFAPDSARSPSKTSDGSAESDAKPNVEKVTTEAVPVGSAEAKPAEKSADKIVQRPEDSPAAAAEHAPSDLFQSLRDQITALPAGPERIRLQLKLAEQLVSAGKQAEATSELRAILNTDVFDPQGFYNSGNAFARLGAVDDAIRAYRKAIEQRNGKYSRALNNLGVIFLRSGRWDEAYDSLISALNLESFHYAEASYNLGRLYSARGERDLAIREWRRALAVDPEHAAAAKALSGTDPSIGERSKFGNSDVRAPGSDTVNLSRAGGSPSQLPATSKINLDPVSYEFLQRARSLSERGKWSESVENYKKVIVRYRGYLPPANFELSRVLFNLKRNDEALNNLLMVTNRDGARYPLGYYYLGRLYAMKGDLLRAEQAFSQAATAFKSENSAILLEISRVREQRKDYAGALAALEEYAAAMEKQGEKPTWVEESLSVLRQKANAQK